MEYAFVAPEGSGPLLVFLHEGLGSLALWKDFPERLCDAAGCRGLLFSRCGYGGSSPRAPGERWPVDFMERQAREFLPAFFRALGIDGAADPPWFYGHSDGGSIALLYAAAFPDRVAGLIVAAPHLFVEDISVESIARARETYLSTDLRERLGRYHDDPDSAFFGWNDVWLDPAFRDWNIEREVARIRCPILAIHGENDEYGTFAQIEAIARLAPQARLLKLGGCGHSPHRDRPDEIVAACAEFVRTHQSRIARAARSG